MENNEQDLPEVPETPNNTNPVNNSNYHYENKITLSQDLRDNLLETAKWGKLLAIFGYVSISLMVIVSIFGMIGMSLLDIPNSQSNNQIDKIKDLASFMGVLYLGIAVLYYFPVTYLYRFADKIKFGVKTANQMSIEEAFSNLKSLYKFMGIAAIVLIVIYGLMVVFMILSAAFFKSL